jgi:hypothetical protein
MEPAMQQDFAMKLAEMGLFQEGRDSERSMLFEFLGFNRGAEQDVDEIVLSQNKAKDENERIMNGEVVMVGEWDNHEVEIPIHSHLPMTPDFRNAPMKQRIALSEHIQAHLDSMPGNMPSGMDATGQFGAPGQMPPSGATLAPPPEG